MTSPRPPDTETPLPLATPSQTATPLDKRVETSSPLVTDAPVFGLEEEEYFSFEI